MRGIQTRIAPLAGTAAARAEGSKDGPRSLDLVLRVYGLAAPKRTRHDPAFGKKRDRMLGFDRRAARYAWTVALVAIALFAVYEIRKTLFIFLLAVFFSYMVYPAVQRLARHTPKRFSYNASTATIFALILGLVVIGIFLIGPPVAEQANTLANKLPALVADPHRLNRVPLPDWLVPFRERLSALVVEQFKSGASAAMPIAKRVGQVALGVAGNSIFIILVPILAFLLVKDARAMRSAFLGWVDHYGHQRMWHGIVDGLDVALGGYIRSLLILSAATLVVYLLVFSIAGVPYAMLLAALAAVLEFIPAVGPLSAALVCLIVASLSGYDHLLLLAVFIAGYRVFQDYVLNPYLMSGGVEIPPLLVLFGLVAGEEVGGVVGIFLSVPTLAAAKIIATQIAMEARRAKGDPASK
jgi:predicted PurR-regulated permease PerM